MKIAFLFMLAAFCLQSVSLEKARTEYKLAAKDESKVDDFFQLMQSVSKESDVALIAYKGASITLKAKYAQGLKNKKEGFVEGATLVEFSIKKDSSAIEPHFVRLTIQENTPKILGYKDDIESDKKFILEGFSNISSSSLKETIKDYISTSKVFSEEEKASIDY